MPCVTKYQSLSKYLGLLLLVPALAQADLAQPEPLSFTKASARLQEVSAALSGADALIQAKQELAKASRSLHGPEISLDVKEMRFSKTLDLTELQAQGAQLGIPLPNEYRELDWRLRPIITATVPIYMGGKIAAAKAVADAQLEQAKAQQRATAQSETVQLVQAYFGQQFAEQVLSVRADVRDGLQQHFEHAEKLERQGFATKAQKLQAKVALDNAEREYLKAQNDLKGAQAALAGLLRSDSALAISTPLFIPEQALPPAEKFTEAALAGHPGLEQIRTLITQAKQKVAAEKANWLPKIYAFGQYDFKQEDALITDSDWAVGVGLSYDLWSNQNRMRQVAAARLQEQQAQFSLEDNATKIAIAIERAWLAADNARQQFALLDSALHSADENLRLQSLSFQAGRATSLDVIDARLQLGKVRIERAQAAWQFDLALIQLLDISGQTDTFSTYITQAKQVTML